MFFNDTECNDHETYGRMNRFFTSLASLAICLSELRSFDKAGDKSRKSGTWAALGVKHLGWANGVDKLDTG